MAPRDTALFDRLDRFYDAVPRDLARVEHVGPLVLFLCDGVGAPCYARPRRDVGRTPSTADLTAVRARQRDLGVPEAFEWIHERDPDLLAVARSAGLRVLEAPLMLLSPDALRPPGEFCDVPVRLADPAAASFGRDLAVSGAVAAVGFAAAGTAPGRAGPSERDAALRRPGSAEIERERRAAEARRRIIGLAECPSEGALGRGTLHRVDELAEVVGITTLPCARRRGLAAAVTAALARRALDDGAELVFLAAGSAEIARVYLRVGFRRVGTACVAEPAPARL